MKYCVIKNTAREIARSKDEDVLIENGKTTRDKEGNFVVYEVLTEEQYQQRLELEPTPPKALTEIELLQEENNKLKTRLYETEIATAETSSMQEELIMILIEMGVI